MWFVCVFLKSRAHKQPWKGPLYSAQPAEMRFNGLGLLSCPFHKKKLKYRKKAGGGGLRARRVPNPNDAISLGARLGWKRLGERLKWFKRCRRGLPSKSCLEWEEGGKKGDAGAEWEGKKKKCQAKSSLHSMQNCSQLRECGRCLKQRTRNILWSRDGGGGQCATVVRGVGRFTKLPTLPYGVRGCRCSPVLAGEFCWVAQAPTSITKLPHQHDKDDTYHLRKLNTKINKHSWAVFFFLFFFLDSNELQETSL